MLGTLNIDRVKTRIVLDVAGDCEAVTLLVRLVCTASGIGRGVNVHS